MKKLLTVLLLIVPVMIFSQATLKKNSGYVQLLGNGLTLSVNYERQLTAKPGLNAQVGIGFGNFKPTIPIGLNYIFNLKSQKSFIETGLSLVFTERDIFYDGFIFENPEPTRKDYTAAYVPSVGYRYHASKGFMYKIVYTPVLSTIKNNFDFFGAGVGWRF
jgi:hypothetical protein